MFLQQFSLNIFNHSIYYYQRIGEAGNLFHILLSGIKLEHRLTMVYPFTLQQLLHAAYWASIA